MAAAVDDLTPALRQQTIDKLISGESSRTVSQWLAQQGHTISFSAIARYTRTHVKPALRTAAKLQQIQQVERQSECTVVDSSRELATVTNQVLKASPLLSRIAAKYDRYDRVIGKAEESEDYKAVASLDAAETRAMTLQAQLEGLLQASQGATGGTTIQIAIATHDRQGQPTIDVCELKR